MHGRSAGKASSRSTSSKTTPKPTKRTITTKSKNQRKSRLLQSSTKSFSTGTTADASTADEPVQFPKTMADRTFSHKVKMPFSRGQAWGQVLVNNQQLPTPKGTWTPQSKRSGIIFTKVGMISLFDQYGMRHGVTVLDIDNCQVMRTHSKPNRFGQFPVEIGASNAKEKNITKPMLGHFMQAKVPPKHFISTGPVSPDAVLPTGWEFDVRHFMVGQYIDVFGVSKGKGFAGGMKRFGFGGQPASHGVSVSHRSLGSTGMRQDPGKVFKNKKMPGHMGQNSVCFENVRILRIDPKKQIIIVKGQIPGADGTHIYARDAQQKPFAPENPPPFPTFVPPADDSLEILTIPNELLGPDPYANGKVH